MRGKRAEASGWSTSPEDRGRQEGDATPRGEGGERDGTSPDEEARRISPLRRLRDAAKAVRGRINRALHPLWRRRALRAVDEAGFPSRVLFVCHGNICRSPYAEKVLEREARGRLGAVSAGLMGPDRPAPEAALRVAAERGVDLEEHRSRLVSDDLLRSAALVVVMDPYQARALRDRHGFRQSLVLGDLDPEPVRRRPIRDPIFRPPEFFREVYGRIDRCVAAMLDAMGLPTEADSPETGTPAVGEAGPAGDDGEARAGADEARAGAGDGSGGGSGGAPDTA